MRSRDLKNLFQSRDKGEKSPERLEQSCCQSWGLAACMASRARCSLGDRGREEFCMGRSRRIQLQQKSCSGQLHQCPGNDSTVCRDCSFQAKSWETTRIQQPPPCSLPLVNARRKQEETAKLLQPPAPGQQPAGMQELDHPPRIPPCRDGSCGGLSDPGRRGDSLPCSPRNGSCQHQHHREVSY